MNVLFRRSSYIFTHLRPLSFTLRLSSLTQKLQFFSDTEDSLDLCDSLPYAATPSWFEESRETSGDERVVSCGWGVGKVDGRKRGEEMEIARLFLSEEIVTRLRERGITRLFPIQRAVLDPAMQGRDMICRAKTGTGKTLAYAIPIMDKIIRFRSTPQAKRRHARNPLALIITPTRELCQQVKKEFKESSSLRTVSVYGGEPIARQLDELNYGVDILVGTPGRINDLLSRTVLNLSHVQSLVLDESDEMLGVSFAELVEEILRRLPRRRQSIMFSSTLPGWMDEFCDIYTNNPLIIDLVGDSAQKLPEGIRLYSIASDDYQKPSIIAPLITEHAQGGKCIVFARAKYDVNILSDFLGIKFRCEALHSGMHQNNRESVLAAFCDGKFSVLVTTDVVARGLHIPDIDLVIHYEVPSVSENFIHRSGRTGRAGRNGKVILIYSEEQAQDVRKIEEDIGCKFKELPRMAVEGGGQLMVSAPGDGFLHSRQRFRPRRSYFGLADRDGSSRNLEHRVSFDDTFSKYDSRSADLRSISAFLSDDSDGFRSSLRDSKDSELRSRKQRSDFSNICSTLRRGLSIPKFGSETSSPLNNHFVKYRDSEHGCSDALQSNSGRCSEDPSDTGLNSGGTDACVSNLSDVSGVADAGNAGRSLDSCHGYSICEDASSSSFGSFNRGSVFDGKSSSKKDGVEMDNSIGDKDYCFRHVSDLYSSAPKDSRCPATKPVCGFGSFSYTVATTCSE